MVRDQQTQDFLNRVHAERQRVKFGVAAMGCALVLSACGGGDEAEDTAQAEPPKPRVDCRVSGACL